MKKRASKKAPKRVVKKAPVKKKPAAAPNQNAVDALLGQLASLLKGAGSSEQPSVSKSPAVSHSPLPKIPRPSPAEIERAGNQLFMPETETGPVPDMSDAHNASWTNDGSMSDAASFSDIPHTRENWLALMGQISAKNDFLVQKIKSLEMMVFEIKSSMSANNKGARM